MLQRLLPLVVLVMAPGPVVGQDPPRARPNVLLIVVDDLGYADLACSGLATDVATPAIDRLAARGVRFTTAYATSPICNASRAGLITGCYQQRFGTFWYGGDGLPAEGFPTLAERLAEGGYQTAYHGKFHYGGSAEHRPGRRSFPLEHGFAELFGFAGGRKHYLVHAAAAERAFLAAKREHRRAGQSLQQGPFWDGAEQVDQRGLSTELLGARASEFLAREWAAPWFLMLSFNAVHNFTHQLPRGYLEQHELKGLRDWDPAREEYRAWYEAGRKPNNPEGRAHYLGQLHYLDREVGAVLDALDARGLTESTVVVLVGDNGGSTPIYADNGPLRGSKYTLYEGGIRVPMIVSWPGTYQQGVVRDNVVSALDLVPTLCAATGGEAPQGVDGLDLGPLLRGEDDGLGHDTLVWDTGHETAVRRGRYKLKTASSRRHADSEMVELELGTFLHDLAADPGERDNLATEQPEVLAELQAVHRRWRAAIAAPGLDPGRAAAKERLQRIVPGAVLIAGGGRLPAAVHDAFARLAGGAEAHIVVMPTASTNAADAERQAAALAPFRSRPHASVTVLHARDRAQADERDFVAPLLRATGVWFGGGQQARLAERYRGTAVQRAVLDVLARGGVVGGTSAGAAVQSAVMIAGGKDTPRIDEGLGTLPGVIVDQHFSERGRQARLRAAVQAHPDKVGLGVDERTAVLVQGRRLWTLGEGAAHVLLAAGAGRAAWTERWAASQRGPVGDLVALRRAAFERTQPRFPAAEVVAPVVEKGTLIMVGGGAVSEGVWQQFITAAGGLQAPFVSIPTALGAGVDPGRDRIAQLLRDRGARDVTVVHAASHGEITAAMLTAVERARGVWFGGGRQWRLVDSYADTAVHAALHGVLRRGGVIAGSSAGTSIQAGYMVRGSPLGNREMMAEGYERGLGFLPGVAVDQHFRQRDRFADMSAVVGRYPQLLGIGIDENTAALVRGSELQVLGRGGVAVYDAHVDDEGYRSLRAGTRYDLAARRVVASR